MPKPFHQLTVPQFQTLVSEFKWTRRITAVHMHHTWQPAHADYKGLATIEGMWNYHVNTKKWSDIAQHVSIAPDGSIWTGRNWNAPPASSKGFNGSSSQGPFMFEIIGDFDAGRDPFTGDQRAAVIAVITTLLDHFKLDESALKFHNQLGSLKTCPGNSVDYEKFCEEVKAARTSGSRGLTAPRSRSAAKPNKALLAIAEQLRSSTAEADDDAGVDCCDHTAQAGSRAAARQWTKEERDIFARYIINLRNGEFIASGQVATTKDDVDRLFSSYLPEALEKARVEGRPLRVLFWAHGGLNSEEQALQHVLDYHQGWLSVGIYPIYFIWETALMTALRDVIFGAPTTRGWVTDITDAALEFTLQIPAKAVWDKIKEYAENASTAPKGGALYVAKKLEEFTRDQSAVELYAVGHSAGAIFHSWFLPAAFTAGVRKFKQLFLLAPAISVSGFNKRLAKRVGSDIDHCSIFTMTEKAERRDSVAKIYRKSLLYFVSYACEGSDAKPILGLQEDIYRDRAVRKLFGIDTTGGGSAPGSLYWSPNGQTSNSVTHGGFDNDPATLHSLVYLITGKTATPFESVAARARPATMALPAYTEAGSAQRRALCVGIDDYAVRPLSGCVNDARQWQKALEQLGFQVTPLINHEATYEGICDALRSLIAGSHSGDHLVFQYAGHGTHVDDLDGDEGEDGQDEALVPIDFQDGHFVIDDDLGDIIDGLPQGVTLTCFMDCCHSGTATRTFGFGGTGAERPNEKSRFMPVPAAVMSKHVDYRRGFGVKAKRQLYAGKPEVLFAACSPTQEAKEQGGHGYFTTTAVPLLLQGAGTLTHAQFIESINQSFPTHVQDQDPQLDCADDRRGQLLLGAAAATGGVQSAGTAANVARQRAREGVKEFDVETLNQSMNLFLRLLDRQS